MTERVSQPTVEDTHDMPPVLDKNGICRFCGTFPQAIRLDPDQLAEFPTGHLHRCRAILRGWPENMKQEEVLEPLKKKRAARKAKVYDNEKAAVDRKE